MSSNKRLSVYTLLTLILVATILLSAGTGAMYIEPLLILKILLAKIGLINDNMILRQAAIAGKKKKVK